MAQPLFRQGRLRRFVRHLPLLVPLLLLAACGQPPQGQDVTLPSGRQVKVLGVGKMLFSNGETALMLKYQTIQRIDDVPALRAETDEIWERFRSDVEKTGHSVAIISAQEKPQGTVVTTNRTYNFVFRKSGEEWSKVAPKA